jgi:hypothetical protein
VRDVEKIPPSKIFEMEHNFFLVTFGVEKPVGDDTRRDGNDDDDGNDKHQEHYSEENGLDDEYNKQRHEWDSRTGRATGMDTDPAASS